MPPLNDDTMNQKALNILSELEGKLKTQGFQLVYCYKNVCIKADPTSFLSLKIDDGFTERNFEEVADVLMSEEDEFKMEVYPKYDFLLDEIAIAIKEQHPEFKQEFVKNEVTEIPEECQVQYGLDRKEETFHIVLTMPTVNKQFHDLATTYVNTTYDAIKASMAVDYTVYSAKVTLATVGDSDEAIDQIKEILEQVKAKYEEFVDTQKKDKLDEIEAAYAKWQEEHPEAANAGVAAPDVPEEGSALSMKMEE